MCQLIAWTSCAVLAAQLLLSWRREWVLYRRLRWWQETAVDEFEKRRGVVRDAAGWGLHPESLDGALRSAGAESIHDLIAETETGAEDME